MRSPWSRAIVVVVAGSGRGVVTQILQGVLPTGVAHSRLRVLGHISAGVISGNGSDPERGESGLFDGQQSIGVLPGRDRALES
jgi:hypothetical protein